jgi:hypothetical protein
MIIVFRISRADPERYLFAPHALDELIFNCPVEAITTATVLVSVFSQASDDLVPSLEIAFSTRKFLQFFNFDI